MAFPVKSFTRIPTKTEWDRFQRCARGMRRLKVNATLDLATSDVFSALQLHTGNDALLPRLDNFDCMDAILKHSLPLFPYFYPAKPRISRFSSLKTSL